MLSWPGNCRSSKERWTSIVTTTITSGQRLRRGFGWRASRRSVSVSPPFSPHHFFSGALSPFTSAFVWPSATWRTLTLRVCVIFAKRIIVVWPLSNRSPPPLVVIRTLFAWQSTILWCGALNLFPFVGLLAGAIGSTSVTRTPCRPKPASLPRTAWTVVNLPSARNQHHRYVHHNRWRHRPWRCKSHVPTPQLSLWFEVGNTSTPCPRCAHLGALPRALSAVGAWWMADNDGAPRFFWALVSDHMFAHFGLI
jgi:hypothetical protein